MNTKIEWRGRLVTHTYPARHVEAQSVTSYSDFPDGVERARIPYGDPKDRYPGGITYATREERIAARIKFRQSRKLALPDDLNDLIEPDEVMRTDHRCSDCDVDVGEFHLPGCCCEVCPRCGGQAIGCDCGSTV